MYLKSIDLYGFKSFAQKIIFKFDKGITGIVGPNGSGKSNIADAVRWVLGEQSAKMLRGAKMQDVIFAGTESRKALGYCQVDLTIDNNDMKMPIDYSEVTVSRRVYRSGESAFFINSAECRLKDIHELFMDTGVGKEGYSIIGQGQIDKILSTKPDDRRELFDEAVGIVKFKKRKQTAQKNLEEEKLNLLRINDIIRELAGQQELLKEQAFVAKQYLDYKEQLKKYEINIFIHESDKLLQNIKELEEKESIANSQVEDVKADSNLLKEKYTQLSNMVEDFEGKIDTKKEEATKLAIEKEKKESRVELVREQINNQNASIERINIQNDDLKSRLNRYIDDKEKYSGNLEQLKASYLSKEELLSKEQINHDELQEVIKIDEELIEQIQTDRIERLNEISNVKTKLQRFQTMLENMSHRESIINVNKNNIIQGKDSVKQQVDECDIKIKTVTIEREKLENEKTSLDQAITNGESELKTKEHVIREKSEHLHTTMSKYKALSEMTEQYEGYGYSIKKIMEQKNSNPSRYSGVLGVVADIIIVQKAYETAIEIALGGSVQNIVTDNEETAKDLINYLKTNRLGRATFLPLTSIKNRDKTLPVSRKDLGFIGYASELVSTDKQFNNIIEYLLGRVVVADNIDNAIAIAKKYHYNLKIVTLSGDVINPGGSLTGGAYKNESNHFLSRKRDLEQYEKDIKDYTKTVDGLKTEYDKLLQEITEHKKKLEYVLNQDYEKHLQQNELAIGLKQLEKEDAKLREELDDLNVELEQLHKQAEEINKSVSELNNALEGNQVENNQAEGSVKKLNDDISQKKLIRDGLSEELTNIRVEVSSLKQQYEHANENMSRINNEIDDINKQIKANLEEIKMGLAGIFEKESSISVLSNEITTQSQQLNELQQQIEALQSERHLLTESQHDVYRKREEMNEQINLLEKDLLKLQNLKDKFEMQRESQMDYMWSEYELTPNKALAYKDETLGSITNIKKMINDLKGSIKALGDVNVNSIEDYKAVSERYTFLTEQKEDLIKSEEKLKKVIEELNEQMVRQFKEKFKDISLKFNEVFRELFGGGKALLELTDDEDVLEAGIELIAQPPGKKLQSMGLLSGGEKAFTAISLLFAIQSLKPSPFCVLDEIEAALDDANVSRFANYLKKLTLNTQFIIITHRRGTMEVADALYGITMQEKGVSTQVSVKLIEDVLEP